MAFAMALLGFVCPECSDVIVCSFIEVHHLNGPRAAHPQSSNWARGIASSYLYVAHHANLGLIRQSELAVKGGNSNGKMQIELLSDVFLSLKLLK